MPLLLLKIQKFLLSIEKINNTQSLLTAYLTFANSLLTYSVSLFKFSDREKFFHFQSSPAHFLLRIEDTDKNTFQ